MKRKSRTVSFDVKNVKARTKKQSMSNLFFLSLSYICQSELVLTRITASLFC